MRHEALPDVASVMGLWPEGHGAAVPQEASERPTFAAVITRVRKLLEEELGRKQRATLVQRTA